MKNGTRPTLPWLRVLACALLGALPAAAAPITDPSGWRQVGAAFADGAPDEATGKLVSPPFRIADRYLVFEVSGAADFQKLRVELHLLGEGPGNIREGEYTPRRATGPGGTGWNLVVWDVAPIRVRDAWIEIVDNSKAPGGRIRARSFRFVYDPPAAGPVAVSEAEVAKGGDEGTSSLLLVSLDPVPGPVITLRDGWRSQAPASAWEKASGAAGPFRETVRPGLEEGKVWKAARESARKSFGKTGDREADALAGMLLLEAARLDEEEIGAALARAGGGGQVTAEENERLRTLSNRRGVLLGTVSSRLGALQKIPAEVIAGL